MAICMFLLPPFLICKHLGINQGDKEQYGQESGSQLLVRGPSGMSSEWRAGIWEWLTTVETG